MRKLYIIITAILAVSLSGCYNDFGTPSEQYEFDDATMQAMGLEHRTIAQIKEMFGTTLNTGNNGSLDDTVYKKFVTSTSDLTEYEKDHNRYILGNYYIKGKVIANDEQGNVYKSLYIWDGTGAIELKLTNGLYLEYFCDLDKIGTGEDATCWIYVRLEGLYLANFRMMLSIGDVPTESQNAYGEYKFYGNSNINSPVKVKEHVFLGKRDKLTEGTSFSDDVYVVTPSTYSSISGASNAPKFLGRLIRFKDTKVMYRGVKRFEGDTPEPLKNGSYDQCYPTWICTSGLKVDGTVTYVVNRPWYRMAYTMNNVALYGSLAIGYNSAAIYTSDPGVYTLRVSGYSRFANNYLPMDGATGDILAIYSIYSKTSTYAGGSYDYATYQLTPCRLKDIGYPMQPKTEDLEWTATLKWAEDNILPIYFMDDTVRPAALAQWKDQVTAMRPKSSSAEWNKWGDWVIWALENTPSDSVTLPQTINDDDND